MRALYAPFNRNHERTRVMDVRSAEFTKYAANAMLATRISFMNELANLADRVGADIEAVRQGIGSDPRIGYQLPVRRRRLRRQLLPEGRAGAGAAPPASTARTLRVLEAVEAVNDAQKTVLTDKVVARFGEDLSGRTLRAVGPGLQAQHRRHARGAQPRGDRARCCAPARAWWRTIRSRSRKPSACSRSTSPMRPSCSTRSATPSRRWPPSTAPDALIIVTEWKAYRSPNLERLKTPMKSPVVFDGRNLYEPAHHEVGRRDLPRHRPQQPARRRLTGPRARRVLRDPAGEPAELAQPTWATILLIVLNMVVFWGPQRAEERARRTRRAVLCGQFAPGARTAGLRRLARDHRLAPRGPRTPRCWPRQAVEPLLDGLQNEPRFLKLLHDGAVITTAHPQHAQWQQDRAQYEQRLPPPFTRRWAQDYSADAELKPWTWLTAAFLHGSTGHLLGNMLFLFLFGFSVELALGRGTYLAFYLLGAVGAALLAGWAYAGKGSIGLGASGRCRR